MVESSSEDNFVEFDDDDRITLRNLSRAHLVASQNSDLESSIETTETGMVGEIAVYKWLRSYNLNVSLQNLKDPYKMKSDLLIIANNFPSIRIEVKTSISHLLPIIPYKQSQRIQENSDYVIFCRKTPEKLQAKILCCIKSDNLSKLEDKKIQNEEGQFIHLLAVKPYLLMSMDDFLTEIKYWKIAEK